MLRLHTLIKAFPYYYNCNCDMLKYLDMQTLDSFKKAMNRYEEEAEILSDISMYERNELKLSFNSLKCGSPAHLYGRYLENVNKTELQCENTVCTDNINCNCIETPYNNTLRINCNKTKIRQMPFINHNFSNLELYLGFNKIDTFPGNNIETFIQVTWFDLSNNFITDIPRIIFSYFPKLRVLNMARNRLALIPSEDQWRRMSSLETLRLSGNQFPCNCSGLKLKETLKTLITRNIIKDVHNIKCFIPLKMKDKVIYNLPDSEFGCPFINLVLTVTLALSFLLFVLSVIFVVYIFRYYIRLFLFIHFGWRFFYTYTSDETMYDVFISYSSKDSDWVIDKLLNPLESQDPPYNVCLHERDFLIGIPICDNIEKAIEGSKCTICVVSNNWLESDWCQYEFRVAHCVATVEKQSRLIVILMEEIPKDKIKGDLKYYMKTFTYLDSAHPLFWSRLLNDLPRPDVAEQRDEHENRDMVELI